MEIKKAYAITDAKITFVSLVDKAANKKTFLITKAEDGKANFATVGRIVKKDSNNHFVTGIVYEPMETDAHDNYMTEEEITKAAYFFMKNGGKADLQHSFEPLEGASIVESWIEKSDTEIDGEKIKKGTWLMTMEITDKEVWKAIEKGEITGFSMGGVGMYSDEDVDIRGVEKEDGQQTKKGLFKKLAEMMGFEVVEKDKADSKSDPKPQEIEKAGRKISSVNREMLQGAYDTLGALLEATEPPTQEEKEKAEQEADNADKSNAETAEDDAETAEEKEGKEEKEVTKSEVEKIVRETVADVVEKALDEAEKETDTAVEKAADAPEPLTAEDVKDIVAKAVDEALAPLLKSRGLPSNLNSSTDGVQKNAEQHYLHGIL